MPQLQHLTQLTHLKLASDSVCAGINPPAEVFSALTASSKLQHLGVSYCRLPAGIWQHMFSTNRQLPHVRSLNMSWIFQTPRGGNIPAPEGGRLATCCPGLQSLEMPALRCNAEGLLPLTQLKHLTRLVFDFPSVELVASAEVSIVLPAWAAFPASCACAPCVWCAEYKSQARLAQHGATGQTHLHTQLNHCMRPWRACLVFIW